MANPTPYTYIQCPCSDSSGDDDSGQSGDQSPTGERTFDPRAARSNYSLYPLEYLLFCEDCQQIRCPRCVSEEIVTYYCPNCLFEVAPSSVRSEGNRCTRSCYQCPVCSGPASVGELPNESEASLADGRSTSAQGSAFALFCQYCNWSSSEIGIEFDRPSGIPTQLSKMENGGGTKLTLREVRERKKENAEEPPLADELLDREMQFGSLKSFYSSQLSNGNAAAGSMSMGGDGSMGFSSPAALSRIMSLYNTGRGGPHGGRAQNGVPDVMREALSTDDGLKLAQLDETAAVRKLHSGGWDETVSKEQQSLQLEPARFQDQLRPTQCVLRTKRSKRCAVCRHIISKPENKVASTRFRIQLVAKSFIPKISIKPLRPTATPVPVGSRPDVPPEDLLKPLTPCQYILTFSNPLFENIKITLATPNNTPGRFSSKVTLLCPQFEVDANVDVWDDALRDDGDRKRPGEDSGSGQAEAGKIYARGRNWVSIILEVIPPSLRVENLGLTVAPGEKVDTSPLREDEDLLEIPMFVRMEWETEANPDVGSAPGKDKDSREKRELAYWCVLGVGRIAQ